MYIIVLLQVSVICSMKAISNFSQILISFCLKIYRGCLYERYISYNQSQGQYHQQPKSGAVHIPAKCYPSGYTPQDCTINQVLNICLFIYRAFDERDDVRFVFWGFSQVFDKVWPTALIYKLEKVGIKG